jgi:hypothetical protein
MPMSRRKGRGTGCTHCCAGCDTAACDLLHWAAPPSSSGQGCQPSRVGDGDSNSPGGTNRAINSAGECLPYKEEVGGSNPSSPTTKHDRAAPRGGPPRYLNSVSGLDVTGDRDSAPDGSDSALFNKGIDDDGSLQRLRRGDSCTTVANALQQVSFGQSAGA